jgi:hypothetical protein
MTEKKAVEIISKGYLNSSMKLKNTLGSKNQYEFSQDGNPMTMHSNYNSAKMVMDPLEESKHREETQPADSEISDNANVYFTDMALGDVNCGSNNNFVENKIQKTNEKNEKVDFYHLEEKNKVFNK